jgi:hypothetical protein
VQLPEPANCVVGIAISVTEGAAGETTRINRDTYTLSSAAIAGMLSSSQLTIFPHCPRNPKCPLLKPLDRVTDATWTGINCLQDLPAAIQLTETALDYAVTT